MFKHSKSLGIALASLLALGAVASSGAQATFSFTSEKTPYTVTVGVDPGFKEVLTTVNGEMECAPISWTGTATGGSATELTLELHYGECTTFGSTAPLNATGCYFQFTTPTAGPAGSRTGGPPHIKCKEGKAGITWTPTLFGSSLCTLTIEPQTPTGGHTIYTNIGSGKERFITTHTTLTGIHFKSSGAPPCGASGVFDYTGTEVFKGYADPSTHSAATQVGILVS